MTILVTGATGFLGGRLLTALRAALPHVPIAVLVRNRRTITLDTIAGVTVQPIEAELKDVDAAVQAHIGAKLSGIVHLAAVVHHSRKQAKATHQANVEGTQAMVRLAQRSGARLVFVSTSGTVGCHLRPDEAPDEHAPYCTATVGAWPYYASKIQSEIQIAQGVAAHALDAVVLRPPVMLGPHDARFRATSLLVRFLRGRLPFYLCGGMHFIDVRDAAQAIVGALQHSAPRPVYNLPGAAMPLKTFFARVGAIANVPAPKRLLPYPVAHAFAALTGGRYFDPVVIEMGRHYWGLKSLYAHEIGYAHRAPQQTLTETVAWLRSAHPELRRARA